MTLVKCPHDYDRATIRRARPYPNPWLDAKYKILQILCVFLNWNSKLYL